MSCCAGVERAGVNKKKSCFGGKGRAGCVGALPKKKLMSCCVGGFTRSKLRVWGLYALVRIYTLWYLYFMYQ